MWLSTSTTHGKRMEEEDVEEEEEEEEEGEKEEVVEVKPEGRRLS